MKIIFMVTFQLRHGSKLNNIEVPYNGVMNQIAKSKQEVKERMIKAENAAIEKQEGEGEGSKEEGEGDHR